MTTPNTTLAPPSPNPAPAKSGIRKVSFGKAAVKKEETRTAYPVFNDPSTGNQVAEIAARIKKRADEIESLEGAQKTDKAELKMFVAPFYFQTNQRKLDPPSSISIPSDAGEVLVTFQNRYTKLTDSARLETLLGDQAERYLRQTFTLAITGEELPAGREQSIVDEVQAVLEKHGASSALEVKEEIKPTKDFHVAWLTAFTPEQNLAIEQACPIVAMIKTKGRGK